MTVDTEKVRDIIDDVVIRNMNKEPHLFGNPKKTVTRNTMYSRKRDKEYVVCRQLHLYIADYVFNNVLNIPLSLKNNGRRLGRDHATSIHSIKTIKNLYGTDPQILNLVCGSIDSVLRILQGGDETSQPHRWYTWLYPKSELF